MRFLPIVERELRTLSRQWGTYWFRTIVASAVGLVAVAIVLVNRDTPPKDAAVYLFHTIGGGALLYCLFVGARNTADCISEEKREGTLGLLFLTDLKGYDVVLGKLVAFSLNGMYGLLAIVPLMAVPLLMGGIKGTQVLHAALALLSTMFLSVAAGVCASACCRSARRAIALTVMIISVLTLVVPAVALARAAKTNTPTKMEYFLSSPIFAYVSPHDFAPWRSNVDLFFASLGVIVAASVLLIGIACFIAPRSWQDRPPGAVRLHWRERWKQWSYGSEAMRRTFRTRLLNENAFFWLAARDRLKPAWVWGLLGLFVCVWAWGSGKYQEDWVSPGIFVITAFFLNCLLKSWFASEATRQISEERRVGSLELLLVTSLRVEDIIRGQALALQRQFFWPVLVVLVCELGMVAAGWQQIYDATDRQVWTAWWIAGMVIFVADLVAMFWVGMWMGLTAKNPKRAYTETIGRVLALPWVVFLVLLVGLVIVTVRSGSMTVGWSEFLIVWAGIALAVDVIFGLWARTNLYARTREVATLRFQRGQSLWSRIFGGDKAKADAAAE